MFNETLQLGFESVASHLFCVTRGNSRQLVLTSDSIYRVMDPITPTWSCKGNPSMGINKPPRSYSCVTN